VVELILVVIIAVLLVWIAIIAYLIFKDRGVIEHVDMLQLRGPIHALRSKKEEITEPIEWFK
jgi:hypothetical protein